ncbi:MAG: hypothetical protein KAG66_24010 [Methylococcales bacterium]|nr:hypothetical protein [Methylococcales bacterium]
MATQARKIRRQRELIQKGRLADEIFARLESLTVAEEGWRTTRARLEEELLAETGERHRAEEEARVSRNVLEAADKYGGYLERKNRAIEAKLKTLEEQALGLKAELQKEREVEKDTKKLRRRLRKAKQELLEKQRELAAATKKESW